LPISYGAPGSAAALNGWRWPPAQNCGDEQATKGERDQQP
jgi:hypothetical protein